MFLDSIEVQTPRGVTVTMRYRDSAQKTTDLSTIGSIFDMWGAHNDEYGLEHLYPATFLDIGGHIGTVTVAVLVDNPACRAVIIEPFAENIEVIRANLDSAGVTDRATVIHGAIGTGSEQRIGYTLARIENADDIHRFVGSPVADDYAGESIVSAVYPLADLIDLLGDTVDLGKIDCEGCEWVALADPAASRVTRWKGEYHGGDPKRLRKLLPKHTVTYEPHDHGATGLFEAARR
jgi:FkbM family methyltransferase